METLVSVLAVARRFPGFVGGVLSNAAVADVATRAKATRTIRPATTRRAGKTYMAVLPPRVVASGGVRSRR
jgi:hypothetical protein